MPDTLHKILILRLSSFGDILLTFPLVHALRTAYPAARIDYVVKREYAEPVLANPEISDVLLYDKSSGWRGLSALKRRILAERYDLVLDIHKNIRSWYLRFLLPGVRIRKYRKYILKRTLLVLFKINLFRDVIGQSRRYFDTLNSIASLKAPDSLRMPIPIPVVERITRILREKFGDYEARTLFAFCPGAGFPTKRWPVEEYARLGTIIGGQIDSAAIVVLGGERDAALGEYIREHVEIPVLNACGLFSFLESAALLYRCEAVIANDTGLMHAAVALGRHVVAVFGPTTRELGYFPDSPDARIIEKKLACRPCSHNGSKKCPEGHFSCMRDIAAEEVWDILKTFPAFGFREEKLRNIAEPEK